jgi:error-prone DNA polymerase
VYVSSWLKVHHPAAFAVALINSQPMGFYSPSTILQDAQKHGVVVLPVAVDRSDWDSTLETEDNAATPSIRLGLRQVNGFGKAAAKRIESAREASPFTSVEDLTARACLAQDDLEALAEAGAFEPLAHGRREAIWQVHAPRGDGLFAGVGLGDPVPRLLPLTRAEQLTLDYARTGLSISDHPMRLARLHLSSRIKSAQEVARLSARTKVSSGGLVICRQRPGTAKGVVFITMEDETGFVNLILYSRIFDEFRHVATTSALLLAHGLIEREGEVVYIVVQRLEKLAVPALGKKIESGSMSRDFH